jgi:hypothetical protein
VGVKVAGSDGPEGALCARQGPLGGRCQRSRGQASAVGEDRRALLPSAGGRRRGRGSLRRCYDGGAGDGGRLGDGVDLRICPGEAELWGG